MQALIDDLLINGSKGDSNKWKKVFSTITKDKELMSKISSAEAARAFEEYYMMGEKRSLQALGKLTGHDKNKLGRWRKKYKWDIKVFERDVEVGTILKARTIKSVVSIKMEYSSMINKLIVDLIRNIEEYNEKVEKVNKKAITPKQLLPYKSLIANANDLEMLVKLDLLMRGEVTERKEQVINDKEKRIEETIVTDAETRDLLRQLYVRQGQFNRATKAITKGEDKEEQEIETNVIDITPSVSNSKDPIQ